MSVKAKSILRNKFGYNEFRDLQQDIIKNVLAKKDTLVIMPTGGGKSICYQIPSLIFEGLTIVISPLISLMKDQVEQLKDLKIDALYLNSSLKKKDYKKNVDLVREGKVKLLYVAPETFMTDATQELLSQVRVDMITIDEAHCVSEWGHDFRPEYSRIASVRDKYPEAVLLALTATATNRVQEDIVHSLQMREPTKYISSFDRSNLFLKVIPKIDPTKQTLEFLKKRRKQPGIIYCFKRKQVETLCEELQAHGYTVRPYHAGLSDQDRETNQELFLKDEIQIIVATIAFGMGINKPNVRFVIHYDLPKSIESYYQEVGRAGRDGLKSDCLLLFSYTDITKFKYLLKRKEDNERQIAEKQINALVEYLESHVCRRVPLLKYFGEVYEKNKCSDMCDNCLAQITGDADITDHVYKYLYCVKELNHPYGLGYIANVLRGVKDHKIFDKRHDDLNSYGTGKVLQRYQWALIARQLIDMEFIKWRQKEDIIELTPKALAFLNKQYPVFGRLVEEEKKSVEASRTSTESEIFNALNDLRKEFAEFQGIPSYAVIPEESLHEMTKTLPRTRDAFLEIEGLTDFKFKKYGDKFIELIQKLNQDGKDNNGVGDIPDSNKYMQIGEKYNKGMPIREIADEFDMKYTIVLDNLFHYINSGGKLQKIDWLANRILGKDTLDKVTDAFDAYGCQDLDSIYKKFNGSIIYDHLKIIRLFYLNEG